MGRHITVVIKSPIAAVYTVCATTWETIASHWVTGVPVSIVYT